MEEINKLIADKDFEVAKNKLKEILDKDEKNLEALKLLGLCCVNLEQFQEGKVVYETVVIKTCIECFVPDFYTET